MCPVWWTSVSTDDWYSNGNKLCTLQGLLKNKDRKLTQHMQFQFRYIDDVMALNNSRFGITSIHMSLKKGYY
jgi:hypothetical protein